MPIAERKGNLAAKIAYRQRRRVRGIRSKRTCLDCHDPICDEQWNRSEAQIPSHRLVGRVGLFLRILTHHLFDLGNAGIQWGVGSKLRVVRAAKSVTNDNEKADTNSVDWKPLRNEPVVVGNRTVGRLLL